MVSLNPYSFSFYCHYFHLYTSTSILLTVISTVSECSPRWIRFDLKAKLYIKLYKAVIHSYISHQVLVIERIPARDNMAPKVFLYVPCTSYTPYIAGRLTSIGREPPDTLEETRSSLLPRRILTGSCRFSCATRKRARNWPENTPRLEWSKETWIRLISWKRRRRTLISSTVCAL